MCDYNDDGYFSDNSPFESLQTKPLQYVMDKKRKDSKLTEKAVIALLTTKDRNMAWAARKMLIELHGDGQNFKSKMERAFPVSELWYTPWFKRSEVKKHLQTLEIEQIKQITEVVFSKNNETDTTSILVIINDDISLLIKDGLPIKC